MIKLRGTTKSYSTGNVKTFMLRNINLDIAQAVITKPKLIPADEPTGNLNSSEGREIIEMFRELNGAGTTIIQVTHSELNADYGPRTIHLLDGWVKALGH